MTYQENPTRQTSYSRGEYQRPSGTYKSQLPPPPKPYDLKSAMKNVNDYELRIPRQEYTFARPQLTYERPSLTFQRPELYLRRGKK